MKAEQRFTIQTQTDGWNVSYSGEMAVVSLAITKALASERQEGTWTVMEYGEPIYHIRKSLSADGGLVLKVDEAQATA